MRIESIKIEGFKNIDKVSIELGEGITALVSPNGYGKSNAIEAIRFAMDFIHADPDSKSEMMSKLSCVPINRDFVGKNFSVEFSFVHDYEDSSSKGVYGFEFEWLYDPDQRGIVKEWLEIREEEKSKRFNKMISRDGNAYYRSSPTGRCSTPIEVAPNELVINRIAHDSKLFYHSIVSELNQITMHDNLTEQIDLPTFLYELKQKNATRFQIIGSALTTVFDDIEAIDAQQISVARQHGVKASNKVPFVNDNSMYSLYVKKKSLNQPIDYRCLSRGEKAVLMMMACQMLSEQRGDVLFCLDEPENSLHPELIQSYIDLLEQLQLSAPDCSILITTQNPFILQYLMTQKIYIAIPNERTAADFRKISDKRVKQLWKDADSCNESAGLYILDLLSSDEDGIKQLKSYLE